MQIRWPVSMWWGTLPLIGQPFFETRLEGYTFENSYFEKTYCKFFWKRTRGGSRAAAASKMDSITAALDPPPVLSAKYLDKGFGWVKI